jgi:hypothetical protein
MGHKKSKTRKRVRQRALAERILAEQERSSDALIALSRSVTESSSGEQRLREIRALLDDLLVAQHRTNQLLELALRAAFDDDERIRATRGRA